MSSGFVPSGSSAATSPPPPPSGSISARDTEWRSARSSIATARREQEAASQHQDGKSLYEVLQANRAAKEEAFQESIKLKNQFRHLDENEADFLDSVLESTREKEAAVKKETEEQLEGFRKLREEADRENILLGEDVEGGESGRTKDEGEVVWGGGQRKRKRVREKEGLKGVKVRRASSSLQQMAVNAGDKPAKESSPVAVHEVDATRKDNKARSPSIPEGTREATVVRGDGDKAERECVSPGQDSRSRTEQTVGSPSKSRSAVALGLGGYSSDEE